MKKKKAKGKTAAKKTAKKKQNRVRRTKELNPAQVLKDISALVEAEAEGPGGGSDRRGKEGTAITGEVSVRDGAHLSATD